ncbi:MAG: Ribosomal RNA large subunit methyltransferase H [Holosporales bacterium]
MQKITLLVGGHMKASPEAALFKEYEKRIRLPLKIVEAKSEKEMIHFYNDLSAQVPCWILLDETGQNFNSKSFAQFFSKNIETYSSLGFIIGVDHGIPDIIKSNTKHQKISFGQMTWPHMLARVLLIEQLYRAQQILSSHPYHRE